jgi:hypothetical protein
MEFWGSNFWTKSLCLQIKWFNIGMTRFVVPWYPILTWATAGNYICRRMLCAFWFRKGLVLLCLIDTLEMASETQVLCCLIPTDANFLKSMPCFRFSVPVGGSEEEALDSQRWGHDMLRDSFRNWCHFGPQFHTVPYSSTQFHIPTLEVLEPRYLRWLLPKSWAMAMGSKSPVGCGSIVDPVAFCLLIVWKVMVIDDWWLIIGDWWWLMVVVWKNVWLVGLPANLSWQDLTYSLHAQWCSHYTTVQTFAYICIVLDVVDFLDVNHVRSRGECDGQKETSYRDGDANAMHENFRSEFLFACWSRS